MEGNVFKPVVNNRAPEMWKIIRPHLPRKIENALDLGCGGGDMLWRLYAIGAKKVIGIDSVMSPIVVERARGFPGKIELLQYDIEKLPHVTGPQLKFDVAFCFSVIPYLKNPITVARWIRGASKLCFFECQYSHEDPFPASFTGDKEFDGYLKHVGFRKRTKIGETEIVIRPGTRSIWKAS